MLKEKLLPGTSTDILTEFGKTYFCSYSYRSSVNTFRLRMAVSMISHLLRLNILQPWLWYAHQNLKGGKCLDVALCLLVLN